MKNITAITVDVPKLNVINFNYKLKTAVKADNQFRLTSNLKMHLQNCVCDVVDTFPHLTSADIIVTAQYKAGELEALLNANEQPKLQITSK